MKNFQSETEYIQTLEVAVRLLMSRLGSEATFTEDEIVEHKDDLILFQRFDTLNGPTHVIKKVG